MYIYSNFAPQFKDKEYFISFCSENLIDFKQIIRNAFYYKDKYTYHYILIRFHSKKHKWTIFQSNDKCFQLYKLKSNKTEINARSLSKS